MTENQRGTWVPIEECERGHVYRLRSRNLAVGVFDGDTGFIGIRDKLGRRYLFCEFHWDTGAPYGTAQPLADLGPVPADIVLAERLGAVDSRSGRPVDFERPVAEGGRGWFYADTGEPDQTIAARPLENAALFAVLDALERS